MPLVDDIYESGYLSCGDVIGFVMCSPPLFNATTCALVVNIRPCVEYIYG